MVTRIIQLTDLHLTARPDGRVFGSDVWANLDRTLNHIETLVGDVDRLVLTGDIANSGRTEAYTRLASRLGPWHDRLRLVPGNHDHRERLSAVFPELGPAAQRLTFTDHADGCLILGLDSLCSGRTLGRLDSWQLDWLRAQLGSSPEPLVLFLHHPPVRVRCWWLDKDLLRDRDQLAALLRPHRVVAIFTGHVHQEHEDQFAGAPVWTTPAVAYQYGPRSWLPLPRERSPAFRLIELACGTVTTSVVRL